MKEQIQTKTLDYEGNQFAVENKNGRCMYNATNASRKFNKRTSDWLRQESTIEYCKALSSETRIPTSDLVVVTKGGSNQGTWMQEDVFLEFARWLDPKFGIWCNQQVKTLITTGFVTLSAPTSKQPSAHATKSISAKSVKAELAFIDHMRSKLRLSDNSYAAMANKMAENLGLVSRVDNTSFPGAISTATKLLAEYGIKMSVNAFNKLMAARGYAEQCFYHGKTKTESYFILTEKGKAYGQNDNNPEHPEKGQIHYLVNKFKMLLDELFLLNIQPQQLSLPLPTND